MTTIAAGFYTGRAVAGSEQYGTTDNGTDQIALDIAIPSLNQTLTTFLFFSDAAAPYAWEKLRACGLKGDDLSKLVGIDENEVTVQIKYEEYKGKQQMKVDISANGGRVKLASTMDEKQKRAFAARMKAFAGAPPPKAAAKPAPRRSTSDDFDPNAGYQGGEDDLPL